MAPVGVAEVAAIAIAWQKVSAAAPAIAVIFLVLAAPSVAAWLLAAPGCGKRGSGRVAARCLM